jgi:hypothetical protein
MKSILILITLVGSSASFAQTKCLCISYPFKPAACFEECVERLKIQPPSEIDKVKGIDAGVAVNLRILSKNNEVGVTVPERAIKNKPDLERAALESMRNREASERIRQ